MKFTKQVTIAAFGIGASFQRVLSVGQDQIGQKNTNDDEPNTEEGGAGAGADGILEGAAAALHPTLEDHRRHLRRLAAAAGDAKGRFGAGAETDSDDQDASAASAAAAAFLKKRQVGGSKEELRRRLQRLRTTGKDVRQTTEKYRQLQECDPSSSPEDGNEARADVGILSTTSSNNGCSKGQSCRPSEDSPLGGYCIDVIAEELVLPEDDDVHDDANAAALSERRLVAPGCTCDGACCDAYPGNGPNPCLYNIPNRPTAGCDYANADGTLNATGNSLVCTGSSAGRRATISNCDTVSFTGSYAVFRAVITECDDVSFTNGAGFLAMLSNIGRATFTGYAGTGIKISNCTSATFYSAGSNVVSGTGLWGMISNCTNVTFTGLFAGFKAEISEVQTVTCDSNDEEKTCDQADITIPINGSVTCAGSPTVALSYQACNGATFTFTGCGDLSCSNGACEQYYDFGRYYGDIQVEQGSGGSFSCMGTKPDITVGCNTTSVPLPDPAPAAFTCTGFDNDSCIDTCATTSTLSPAPSSSPSVDSSQYPSAPPSTSSSPSLRPSTDPSHNPSAPPSTSSSPSLRPSTDPSHNPSASPSTSSLPSSLPSDDPSHSPSSLPSRSASPTSMPSKGPSQGPSASPSGKPSRSPSSVLQIALSKLDGIIMLVNRIGASNIFERSAGFLGFLGRVKTFLESGRYRAAISFTSVVIRRVTREMPDGADKVELLDQLKEFISVLRRL